MNASPRTKSQRSSFDVSPITASPSPFLDNFPKDGHRGSSIPIPAKHPKAGGAGVLFSGSNGRVHGVSLPNRDSALTTLTRWDDFSGEPTTNKARKPAQATPGAVNLEFEPVTSQRANSIGNISAISSRYNCVHKKAPKKPHDEVYTPKEAWKGASGRHAIPSPLLDKPLPPGESPRFLRGTQTTVTNTREPSLARKSSASAGVQSEDPKSVQPLSLSNRKEPIYSHDPLASGGSRFLIAASLTHSEPETHGDISPSAVSPSAELMRHMHVPISPAATPGRVSNVQDLDVAENDFRAKMNHMHLEDQLPSRFSATTYDTTACDSPPATFGTRYESPMQTPSWSVLDRKRPIPVAGIPNSRVTARKPTASDLNQAYHADSANGRLSKSLPKSPPEVEAVTRVANLEAQLENLRRRRGNLQTVIHELTNVFQTSSIAYDIASRQEIKKTVDGLHKELADVIKEEHGTGLQLHRAWKRHDNDSAYENSSLWVKRLAS